MLEDVEWEVFVGLVEWAYLGDYAGSLPMKVEGNEDESPLSQAKNSIKKAKKALAAADRRSINWRSIDQLLIDQRTVEEVFLGDTLGSQVKLKRKRRATSSSHISDTGCALWVKHFSKQPHITGHSPSAAAKKTIKEVSTSAGLCYHAKLCVLVDRYLVNDLKNLCLTNLYKILVDFDFDATNVDIILDLLDYVYMENGVEGVPELRQMVLLYVAAKLADIKQNDRFKRKLREVGDLGTDLLEALLEIDQ